MTMAKSGERERKKKKKEKPCWKLRDDFLEGILRKNTWDMQRECAHKCQWDSSIWLFPLWPDMYGTTM